MTLMSHMKHYQICNCLADSAECCQPGCSCKEPVTYSSDGQTITAHKDMTHTIEGWSD